MSKSGFLVLSIILLAAVVFFVVYKVQKSPDSEAKLQKISEEQSTMSGIDDLLTTGSATPQSSTDSAVKGTQTSVKSWSTAPALTIDASKKYTATMSTIAGDMTFDLFASEDPLTVNNFVFLSQNNFYDGLKFHRIIQDFMIQGGDPVGNGTGGPGYKFADEKVTRDYVVGTLAMANSGPNTNGSQFFIMTKDTPLPKNYTIFGILTVGQDVLAKIAATPTTIGADGAQSKPLSDVVINSVLIAEN